MKQLTPELWCTSAISGAATAAALETRELDFDMARRTALVICRIEGFLGIGADATSGFSDLLGLVQELSVDPDDVDTWQSDAYAIDAVEYDTARVFRQRMYGSLDTAAGTVTLDGGMKQVDWSHLPYDARPITTRNLRHNVEIHSSSVNMNYEAELNIRYILVELSLEELGYINASRR